MESVNIDNEITENDGKLPVFLKVLCILTFVGSGLGLLSGIAYLTFLTPDSMYDVLVQNASKTGADLPSFEEYSTWATYSNIVAVVSSLLGILAAVMMWRRQKAGYFIYIFSWVASLVMTTVAFDHISDTFTAKLFPIMIAVNILIMAAFVIMYGVNLKHMNR